MPEGCTFEDSSVGQVFRSGAYRREREPSWLSPAKSTLSRNV